MAARAKSAPHVPTAESRAQVKSLVSFGHTHDEICAYVGITGKTLRKYYREEIDNAQVMANAQIAAKLFKAANSGNTAAMIFWLKSRAGWNERLDLTNTDGSLKPPSRIELVSGK